MHKQGPSYIHSSASQCRRNVQLHVSVQCSTTWGYTAACSADWCHVWEAAEQIEWDVQWSWLPGGTEQCEQSILSVLSPLMSTHHHAGNTPIITRQNSGFQADTTVSGSGFISIISQVGAWWWEIQLTQDGFEQVVKTNLSDIICKPLISLWLERWSCLK